MISNLELLAIVIVLSMLLATVAGLIYLAMGGDTWATGILFGIWSITCVVVGAGIVIVVNRNQAAREQRDFVDNLKENLALMSAMQSIQMQSWIRNRSRPPSPPSKTH